MTFDQFEEFLLSAECHWEHDVSYIDKDGLQHYLDKCEQWEYQSIIARWLADDKITIKVEQMEKRYHWKDRTIHFFYSPAWGPTFDTHTDPVDVIIDCHDGIKHMEVNGTEHIITPGGAMLLIPAGTPHRALNYEKALIASHGINDTETLSNIR